MKNIRNGHEKKDIEKVLFGEDINTCFVCGEKLTSDDIESENCPYCGTELPKKDVNPE